ncbi:lipoprotein-releasing system permease protein [Tenacibaculum sp. MAR_2009_124]|uniref:ABC transporter permease n=1 Tax=Tenacibaculum sp. MAR_2009_124 TaxID=1250059 RepID=UPI000896FDB9|nr:ABC transporter permease [Tenacibaculum sp. MAR_2009_124]SED20194.1 lipoprotein-releasing system permease protein [Tenacibaculum sp. MAR_2009_124]
MNFPLYIAKRYLFAKNSTNAINIITFIATFSVIVGTAALFIVLSGFSGLRTFSDSLLEASDPDMKILPVRGKTFKVSDKLVNSLVDNPKLNAFSCVVEERVSLSYKSKNYIAFIKGVDKYYTDVVQIDSALNIGVWLDKKYANTAVIGAGISYKLSLGAFNFGDPLQVMVPKPGTKFITNPNKAFTSIDVQIVGVYTGSEEFQNKFVFTHIDEAQKLLNYDDNDISAIEVKVKDVYDVEDIKEELVAKLGDEFEVKTKKELNALYYKVVNTENFISYLIFTLIIVIALFNVIGSIIMMIIDKRKNLKTLLSLGTSVKDVKRIFVYQGFLLVLVGLSIGLFIGVALVFIQLQFGVFMITDSLPYPVELQWINFFVVLFTIVVLGFIASKIASSRINRAFIER